MLKNEIGLQKCLGLSIAVLMLTGILPAGNLPAAPNPDGQEKPDLRVGIYKGFFKGYRCRGLIAGLDKQNIHAVCLTRIKPELFNQYDVIIVTQQQDPSDVNRCAGDIRSWVEKGGGIMFLHDAVGYRGHAPIFKEVGTGLNNPKLHELKVTERHPVTKGISIGYVFLPGFQYDHIAVKPGSAGTVLVKNEQEDAVVVVGEVGKGRVVLNGMFSGFAGDSADGSGRIEEPSGDELKILVNAIQWLAGKGANTSKQQ